MDIKILQPGKYEEFHEELLAMVSNADREFVPPLSARSSTTQPDLSSDAKASGGILSYFNEMTKQGILVACQGDALLGFVSFKENYTNDVIKQENCPNLYISTLIIKPEARGQGLTQTMYQTLFKTFKTRNIITRTWSSNQAHIKILSKFDFETLAVLQNDRGEGIDTIYFIKRRERK